MLLLESLGLFAYMLRESDFRNTFDYRGPTEYGDDHWPLPYPNIVQDYGYESHEHGDVAGRNNEGLIIGHLDSLA